MHTLEKILIKREADEVPKRSIKPTSEDGMGLVSIRFEQWESVLRTEVPPERQRDYREAIVKFLYWLRQTGKAPDAETFKEHLYYVCISARKPSNHHHTGTV